MLTFNTKFIISVVPVKYGGRGRKAQRHSDPTVWSVVQRYPEQCSTKFLSPVERGSLEKGPFVNSL